jgi:two-component system sensor histidine kinase AlgZ
VKNENAVLQLAADGSSHAALESGRSPTWILLAAALPLTLCLAILSLPDIGEPRSNIYRAFFFCAYLVWIFPLSTIQRYLWRRKVSWLPSGACLLAVTYGMSVVNSILVKHLAVALGNLPAMRWDRIFHGLDECWLLLIAFCAVHAVFNFYNELSREKVRVAEALRLAQDAELRALRYQLHPHFLFNTLNAISTLVVSDRNREANRMITQLADFLRATLAGGNRHEHALADELALTEGYLEIEKARLGDKLVIGIHVGPDVLSVLVPYLILQPLMENAVRHGIALRANQGYVDLRIAKSGARLHICLRNDGPPFAPAEAESGHGSYRIGMRNVAERLTRLYGADHAFSMTPKEDGAFEVDIAIPIRPAPEAKA